MLVHFVGQQDRYQLGDAGKDQISMKGLFVLCFPSGKTKRLFYMMDERSTAVRILYAGPPIQVFRAACRDKCAVLSPDRYRPSVRRGESVPKVSPESRFL